ncbi:hypothetical protein Poli38472_009264 [Pythium oligandrum]|uniref:Uncharacterized protein n=1 Tax=Pythium oligandrum TaxID=41045 RepID=A0A8K1CMJ7_PYTOL|nr:hypothetical protein Poli38472_009264 [Pythium oligandrum]|eukprot:TMW65097.1 hypothetical protein Poli38472_009264 [Pythium oligandrum]
MRKLQRRYFFVGWDAFTAIEVLDMDPYDPALVDGEVALARCSLGSLLQLLYQSGPSSFVGLAGDYLFVGSGFSEDPVEFYYPVRTAKQMGIYSRHLPAISPRMAVVDGSEDSSTGSIKSVVRVMSRTKNSEPSKRSIFEHHFKLVAEGYLGQVFLLDDSHSGVLTKNEDTGMREFVRAVLIRQLLTQVLNVIATVLTLITGIKDNPIVVGVTGRYKFFRSRLQDGSINYDIARMEAIKPESFVRFAEVGKSYSFFSTPYRNPATMGLDRSLCLRVNSMNSTTYAVYFDEYWGKGPRRTIRYVNSISAPNCQLINFRPAWYKSCINDVYKGNQTACNQYVVDHFKELQDNVLVQVNNDKSDFGEVGMPVLKCVRRPDRPFDFNMDLNLQHSYWAGNIFHFELQTSVCRAKPLLRTPDWEWTLFQVVSVDQNAKTAIAVAESGVVGQIVTPIYGIVAISMLAIGIYAAITRNRTVKYLPDKVRYAENRRLLRYLFPFMNAAVLVTDQARAVITFKGSIMTASNIWLNHWLYILVSIVNAVVHLRMCETQLGNVDDEQEVVFPVVLVHLLVIYDDLVADLRGTYGIVHRIQAFRARHDHASCSSSF